MRMIKKHERNQEREARCMWIEVTYEVCGRMKGSVVEEPLRWALNNVYNF